MIEVDYQIKDYANISVASEGANITKGKEPPTKKGETGWNYTDILYQLKNHPEWTPEEFAKAIVKHGENNPYIDTLSAINLTAIDDLKKAVDEFAKELRKGIGNYRKHNVHDDNVQVLVRKGRLKTQTFGGVIGEDVNKYAFDLEKTPLGKKLRLLRFTVNDPVWGDMDYIDLYHFTELIDKSIPSAHKTHAKEIMKLLKDRIVIENYHSNKFPNAHGVSIYFPYQQKRNNTADPIHEYQYDNTSPLSPTRYNATPNFLFPEDTLWNKFLHCYYQPVADAGEDKKARVNKDIKFLGNGSSDSDFKGDFGSKLVANYTWDFGDGTSYSETWNDKEGDNDGAVDPGEWDARDKKFDGKTTHQYTKKGVYTVKLCVKDDDYKTDCDSAKVVVSPTPTPTPTPTPVHVTPPTSNYPMLQYDAQRTGNVSGIAPETASLLWQSGERTAGCIEAGPIVSGGMVYISTWWSSGICVEGHGTDALYCLNVSTGEEIWNKTEVYGASTAAIADGKLFVGTHSGNIACVDMTSGEILWSKKIEENPSWYGVASSPLVVDDEVYVLSFSDGTLHAFSFDGTEHWDFSTSGEIFCYSSPSAYRDKIFFAGNNKGQHALYCLDLNTREEVWKFTTETEIRGSPTIWSDEKMVFFTTKYVYGKPHKLYAVNITTGDEVWNVTHYSSWASPALSNGKLYIGGSAVDTTFYCYDALNGSLSWENEEMGGAIDSSPVVADGKVYFGTNEVDGTIYAMDANNGTILWNYTLYIPHGFGGGFNVASHPAISNRTLFIGVDNLGVLAFRDAAFWEGEVTLREIATVTVTAHNSGESYEITQTTALGALDAAAEVGGFNYTISDEWYASWGCLTVDSIAGKENAPVTWDGWLYWVNYPDDPMPMVGVNLYEVEEGDVVTYYYGGMSTTPDNSSMIIRIHIHVVEVTPFVSLNPVASVVENHWL